MSQSKMQSVNPELFSKFFAAVKDGKVEGFDRCHHVAGDLDTFCADIRRWLTSEGVDWTLSPDCLVCAHDTYISWIDRDGTEVDWHLAAALWWLEQKGLA